MLFAPLYVVDGKPDVLVQCPWYLAHKTCALPLWHWPLGASSSPITDTIFSKSLVSCWKIGARRLHLIKPSLPALRSYHASIHSPGGGIPRHCCACSRTPAARVHQLLRSRSKPDAAREAKTFPLRVSDIPSWRAPRHRMAYSLLGRLTAHAGDRGKQEKPCSLAPRAQTLGYCISSRINMLFLLLSRA